LFSFLVLFLSFYFFGLGWFCKKIFFYAQII
jgi:hypothetical protein